MGGRRLPGRQQRCQCRCHANPALERKSVVGGEKPEPNRISRGWLVTMWRLHSQRASLVPVTLWWRNFRWAGVGEEGIQILADPAVNERRDVYHAAQGAARRKVEEAGTAIGGVSLADHL